MSDLSVKDYMALSTIIHKYPHCPQDVHNNSVNADRKVVTVYCYLSLDQAYWLCETFTAQCFHIIGQYSTAVLVIRTFSILNLWHFMIYSKMTAK